MAKCTHCSAPLPSNSIICDYCGVRNDIELTPKVGHTLPQSKRMCPDCLVYLESIDIGQTDRFIIEKCSRCYGLFLDLNELETLLTQSVGTFWIDHQKLHSLQQHPLHKDEVIYRKCPECSKIMHRKNYLNRSGVIMDVCFEHGIWLDAGELKHIQEWSALGGKALAQQSLAIEELKSLKREKIPTTHSASTHYTPKSLEEKFVEGVFDLLSGVLRHF